MKLAWKPTMRRTAFSYTMVHNYVDDVHFVMLNQPTPTEFDRLMMQAPPPPPPPPTAPSAARSVPSRQKSRGRETDSPVDPVCAKRETDSPAAPNNQPTAAIKGLNLPAGCPKNQTKYFSMQATTKSIRRGVCCWFVVVVFVKTETPFLRLQVTEEK
jgi:hypothetical protein